MGPDQARSRLGPVFVLLLWLCALQGLGLYLFLRGFLLTRRVLDAHSTTPPAFDLPPIPTLHSSNSTCGWLPGTYQRAVLLVVDALRHDFLFYNDTAAADTALGTAGHFTNRLPTVNRLLREARGHEFAQVYKFIADAPTTTMQRIKGLTTGSLPTFIDAGSNFASTAITEDSWVHHMQRCGRKVVHMGDDTWVGLFPTMLARSYPFDSFNVRDLHTVDNGVRTHIFPELKEGDWAILIGHLLGVDHCGHTFGPHSPFMAEKLKETDDLISQVVASLPSDTILLVFGDHGMTESGDHGGDSAREVEAGLFVYAPHHPGNFMAPKTAWDQYLRASDQGEEGDRRTVQQVDLVATISLLLGTPIPFGNLGEVIPELFFTDTRKAGGVVDGDDHESAWWGFERLNRALVVNAGQMHHYLHTYGEGGGMGGPEMVRLQGLYKEALGLYRERGTWEDRADVPKKLALQRHTHQALTRFISEARAHCRQLWAQFDVASMAAGLLLLAAAIAAMLANVVATAGPPHDFRPWPATLTGGALGCVLALVAAGPAGLLPPLLLAGFGGAVGSVVGHVGAALRHCWARTHVFGGGLGADVVFGCVVLACHVAVPLSNSYAVHADSALTFLTATLCAAYALALAAGLHTRDDLGKFGSSVLACVCVPLIARVSTYLSHVCREEQLGCVAPPSTPLWAVGGLVAAWACGVYYWMRHWNWRQAGNQHGGPYMVLGYFLPLAVLGILAYWLLIVASGGNLATHPSTLQTFFPKTVYGLTAVSLYHALGPAALPVFPYKGMWAGEATGLAAGFMTIATIVQWLGLLVTEWRYAVGVLGAGLSLFGVLQAHTGLGLLRASQGLRGTVDHVAVPTLLSRDGSRTMALRQSDHSDQQQPRLRPSKAPRPKGAKPPAPAPAPATGLPRLTVTVDIMRDIVAGDGWSTWGGVVLWSLASSVFFYATGHQTSFPTIQWSAAFVGLVSMQYYPALLLVSFNTLYAPLLASLTLPLLTLWACGRSRRILLLPGCETLLLAGPDPPLPRLLSRTCTQYLLYRTCTLFGAAAAAGLHRRHLMVWKIFAPQLLYEGATLITVAVGTLAGVGLVARYVATWARYRVEHPPLEQE